MKAIELTKEHKSKLLEMCIELYQNNKVYNHISILRNNHVKIYKDYKGTKDRWESYALHGTVSIHWFEFCMIYLIDKLNFEPDILLNQELKNKHLIDYLYEQFKNLKK